MKTDFDGKNVYLSGPMTGAEGRNRDAFNAAERFLRRNGASLVRNPSRTAPKGQAGERGRHLAALGAIQELCETFWDRETGSEAPFYDVLALIPGWNASKGSRLERDVAEAVGIEVVELDGGEMGA